MKAPSLLADLTVMNLQWEVPMKIRFMDLLKTPMITQELLEVLLEVQRQQWHLACVLLLLEVTLEGL